MDQTPEPTSVEQGPSGREKWEEKRRAKEDERRASERNRVIKRIAIWGGSAALLVLAVWGVVKLAGSAAALPDASGILTDQISSSDWVIGNPSSSTVLVEYADFQCPACAAYHPVLKQLMNEESSSIVFVYRYFPLTQHLNGKPAAYAAEAAGRQGKFWQMHDMLFEYQSVWENASDPFTIFEGYAESLKLDTTKFRNDYALDDVHTRVDRDYASGLNERINQTPTFYLNGKQIANPASFEDFKTTIKNAIPKQ